MMLRVPRILLDKFHILLSDFHHHHIASKLQIHFRRQDIYYIQRIFSIVSIPLRL